MYKKLTNICLFITMQVYSFDVLAQHYSVETKMLLIEHRNLNNQFIESSESSDPDVYQSKRGLLEKHRESVYIPALRSLEKKFCSDPNVDVLDEFIATLINTSNSAVEFPSYVFARLFSCNPGLIENRIGLLNSNDKNSILVALDWGFKNITYKKEGVFPNFNSLQSRLNALKG